MARRARIRSERFTISAVSEMYDIHQQTLRMYEREELLAPSRSQGNTRLYSRDDLERLEVILNLTRDLGVNIAGVQIILDLREKLVIAVDRLSELEELLRSDAFEEIRMRFSGASAEKGALIPASVAKLVRLKRRTR
jgi:MerR family transcriptional regulator/heat shock protein HspR